MSTLRRRSSSTKTLPRSGSRGSVSIENAVTTSDLNASTPRRTSSRFKKLFHDPSPMRQLSIKGMLTRAKSMDIPSPVPSLSTPRMTRSQSLTAAATTKDSTPSRPVTRSMSGPVSPISSLRSSESGQLLGSPPSSELSRLSPSDSESDVATDEVPSGAATPDLRVSSPEPEKEPEPPATPPPARRRRSGRRSFRDLNAPDTTLAITECRDMDIDSEAPVVSPKAPEPIPSPASPATSEVEADDAPSTPRSEQPEDSAADTPVLSPRAPAQPDPATPSDEPERLFDREPRTPMTPARTISSTSTGSQKGTPQRLIRALRRRPQEEYVPILKEFLHAIEAAYPNCACRPSATKRGAGPVPLPDDFSEFYVPVDIMEAYTDTFYVEEILDHKIERGQLKFLIKWDGYSERYNSWEPHASIFDETTIDTYFEKTKRPVPPLWLKVREQRLQLGLDSFSKHEDDEEGEEENAKSNEQADPQTPVMEQEDEEIPSESNHSSRSSRRRSKPVRYVPPGPNKRRRGAPQPEPSVELPEESSEDDGDLAAYFDFDVSESAASTPVLTCPNCDAPLLLDEVAKHTKICIFQKSRSRKRRGSVGSGSSDPTEPSTDQDLQEHTSVAALFETQDKPQFVFFQPAIQAPSPKLKRSKSSVSVNNPSPLAGAEDPLLELWSSVPAFSPLGQTGRRSLLPSASERAFAFVINPDIQASSVSDISMSLRYVTQMSVTGVFPDHERINLMLDWLILESTPLSLSLDIFSTLCKLRALLPVLWMPHARDWDGLLCVIHAISATAHSIKSADKADSTDGLHAKLEKHLLLLSFVLPILHQDVELRGPLAIAPAADGEEAAPEEAKSGRPDLSWCELAQVETRTAIECLEVPAPPSTPAKASSQTLTPSSRRRSRSRAVVTPSSSQESSHTAEAAAISYPPTLFRESLRFKALALLKSLERLLTPE